jgi:hypothetical protein
VRVSLASGAEGASGSGENPLTWEVVAKQASGDAWTVLCQLPNKASWTLGEYFEQTFLSLSYASQAVSSTASNSVTPTYDGPAATFAVTSGSLPSGMSLNSSTGELTGTAGSTQSGIVITATLSDGSGVAVVSSSFTLTAAVGYRYYFLEFITTPNGFIGASTIKLLDAGSTDHALSSGGAVATTVSYTQNGSFPVTNCNDGNDTSFTTSSAGTAAASGHGILIDMGSIYDITKLGYRSRSDSFGTVEAHENWQRQGESLRGRILHHAPCDRRDGNTLRQQRISRVHTLAQSRRNDVSSWSPLARTYSRAAFRHILPRLGETATTEPARVPTRRRFTWQRCSIGRKI